MTITYRVACTSKGIGNALFHYLRQLERVISLSRKEFWWQASATWHPIKRVGTHDKIGRSVLLPLAEDSSWIAGQVLHIDSRLLTLRYKKK